MKRLLAAFTLALCAQGASAATQLFPLSSVRLQDGPFLQAQDTDLRYLMALDADKLLAPFLREAGLPATSPSYGNWESSGLDGHMGGHYVSALALMWASTGDAEVKKRLDYVIAELKRCQDALGNGYIGGVPDGAKIWGEVGSGQLKVDSFSVNGRWVPWYNIHKLFAGLRDAWVHAGNADAKAMLVRMSDWALRLTTPLSDQQMQDMLRAEHGGMNEIFADVAGMTGDLRYLALARRFSHQAILQPLAAGQDKLTGLHANTQIPKVIGFARIAQVAGEDEGRRAAEFFWRTVVDKRSVAIGGNSVREHFHPADDFKPMLNEVEGPETCNSYNMLKLTALLAQAQPEQGRYADYYERTLYNHILASQHPGEGGFVYFTPMRPQHYRVYSQVHEGMWCCVGSGIESHARHGEFIYAHDGDDALLVNLFIASTLDWRERGIKLTQSTRFPDESRTRLTVDGAGSFALKIRYPGWVAPGALKVKLNGKPVAVKAAPGGHVELRRDWKPGDQVDVELPMRTRLEPMHGLKNHVAVLHGPIVLAAKTPQPGETLNFKADGSRMGHIAHGAVCPQEAAPVFVSPHLKEADIVRRFKPVPGQPLTFTAPGLIQGGKGAENLQLIPFFRLHDSRYMLYWARSTPAQQSLLRQELAKAEEARLALDAITIDQVAPGEQQPESDHGFKGEGAESGIAAAGRWRHAKQWFSYVLNDPKAEARVLRLSFSTRDAGRRFELLVNGQKVSDIELASDAGKEEVYTRDFELPAELVKAAGGKLEVKFLAKPGSIAGGLYGLRLLR